MLSLKQLRLLPSVRRFFHIEHPKHEKKLPDPWDLMTGVERWVAIEYAKGNTDPFFRKMRKLGPGTKDCPNIVPSVMSRRIVACVCDEDTTSIIYWWIHEGYPRRCLCNHWFVLERVELPKIYEDD